MISIAMPMIGNEEISAVNDVLQSGMLAQGPKVAELEKAFAEYCGTKHALAVNSGTAAIHAALFAAGVQPGDEVITTPFSFIATINPILMLGATPVVVDIDSKTYNIDPQKIEAAITNKTKVILPVHLYGQPCDWSEVQSIADKHGLVAIEDACQAVGATYADKKAGGLGDLACFSLYATKNIMCGEGGMVTTNSDEYADTIRRFRQHGMSGPYQYEHIGYNYRLTDLQAAIAVEQLKKADLFSKKRQENAESFNNALASIEGVELPFVEPDRTHVYHQYTIRITDKFPVSRDEFVQAMREKGIGAGVYYPKSLYSIKHIAKSGRSAGELLETERACAQVVSLPIHPMLSKEDIDTVITAIKDIARNA